MTNALLSQAALIEAIKVQFTPGEVEKLANLMKRERQMAKCAAYLDTKELPTADRRKVAMLIKEATPKNLRDMGVLADPYIRGDLVQLLPTLKAVGIPLPKGYPVKHAEEAVTSAYRLAELFHLDSLSKLAAEFRVALPKTVTKPIERPKDKGPRYYLNMSTLEITPA